MTVQDTIKKTNIIINSVYLICFLSVSAVTNQYSAALNLYLQAGAVCSDFFTKAVPPDVYTDQVASWQTLLPHTLRTNLKRLKILKHETNSIQSFLPVYMNGNESLSITDCSVQVLKRMIKCCSMMNCHTQVRGRTKTFDVINVILKVPFSVFWSTFHHSLRLLFSASFSEKWTTWRRSRLFKNRTGKTWHDA